jgi:hypothetical protein
VPKGNDGPALVVPAAPAIAAPPVETPAAPPPKPLIQANSASPAGRPRPARSKPVGTQRTATAVVPVPPPAMASRTLPPRAEPPPVIAPPDPAPRTPATPGTMPQALEMSNAQPLPSAPEPKLRHNLLRRAVDRLFRRRRTNAAGVPQGEPATEASPDSTPPE